MWYEDEDDGLDRDVIATLAALVAFAVLVLAACFWAGRRSAQAERAAYLEGRWGLDHETAMAYAK